MDFSFRHRIELHEPQSLPVSESELVLEDSGESRVVLVSRGRDTDISQTQHLALLGSGYESEVGAHRAGEGWRSILQRVFAANRVGADFGDRSPGVDSPLQVGRPLRRRGATSDTRSRRSMTSTA
jgi:hypothetical protein